MGEHGPFGQPGGSTCEDKAEQIIHISFDTRVHWGRLGQKLVIVDHFLIPTPHSNKMSYPSYLPPDRINHIEIVSTQDQQFRSDVVDKMADIRRQEPIIERGRNASCFRDT